MSWEQRDVIEQRGAGADNVGLGGLCRCVDRPVDVALRGEVHHHVVAGDDLVYEIGVTDIADDESMPMIRIELIDGCFDPGRG